MFSMAVQLDPRAKLVEDMLYRLNLSERWLAERLGVNNVSVNEWIKGRKSPRDKGVWSRMLETIRAYELETRKSGELRLRNSGTVVIPLYGGITASPMSSTQSDVETIEIPDMGTGRNTWARRVVGMSMSPLLEPGDIVVFDDRAYEPGNVVHAFDAGEDCVKVATGRGKDVRLRSINPDFGDENACKANVKGVAVMRIRNLPHDEEQINKFPHGMRWKFED